VEEILDNFEFRNQLPKLSKADVLGTLIEKFLDSSINLGPKPMLNGDGSVTLALSPIRDTLIEGFSHFVSSMTAPIASGWSDCRVGLAPTGKRRLCTAHARSGQWQLHT
jgi:hypothetical protein